VSAPSITAVKTLFAHSRNTCFFTRCEENLTRAEWAQVNAEIAHIKGEKPTSARYDPDQADTDRQGYDNLMLLCPKHHKLIDRLEPLDYDVPRLVEMRELHISHEAAVQWATDEQLEIFAILAVQDLTNTTPNSLEIREAKYGEKDTWADVTDIVAGKVVGNRMALSITNDALGGDPLPNVVKKLTLIYELDGNIFSQDFDEGSDINLPPI
jgi:hypothetical protein